MEIKDNRIKADEGMMLTNGNAYGKTVELGFADDPKNWQEITLEEYMAILEKEE